MSYTYKASSQGGLVVVLILLILLILVGPFLTIWALNTLFGLGIAYSLATYGAVVWLGLVLKASANQGKDK